MSTLPVPLVAQAGAKPDQVGIIVPDLERAVKAWGPAGTWRIWGYGPGLIAEQEFEGKPAEFSMRLALSGTTPEVELIEAGDGPSIYHQWIDEHGYGLHHLGYQVDDARLAIEQMAAAGYPVLQAGFGLAPDGSGAFAYFGSSSALGLIVELIERPVQRRPPDLVWPQ